MVRIGKLEGGEVLNFELDEAEGVDGDEKAEYPSSEGKIPYEETSG